ncbi:MAG: carbonic anhydrase [Methylophilaceae bacterium]
MYMHPEIDRDQMSPQQAIEILQQGNERFVNNVKRQHDMLSVRDELKDKQHPFASILSCSDSRTTVELIFDQNLGDIFSVRLAGNVASTLAIGSLEFSTEYLGSKLVVVMGHSNCGAVKAACDHFKGGNIGEIINMIDPAVSLETTVSSDRNSSNTSFVDKVCWHNVHEQINNIKQHSKIINQMVIDNQIALVGAVYDLASGSVQFDI